MMKFEPQQAPSIDEVADEIRSPWVEPALTRMEAGKAENSFPGVIDQGFTYS